MSRAPVAVRRARPRGTRIINECRRIFTEWRGAALGGEDIPSAPRRVSASHKQGLHCALAVCSCAPQPR